MQFRVIDTQTGEVPYVEKIVLNETWAKDLIYCDISGFVVDEEGSLLLMDDTGKVAYCPPDRFEIIYMSDDESKVVFELVGIRIYHTPYSYAGQISHNITKEVVATFDTLEAAEKYIKCNKLAKIQQLCSWDSGRGFKKRSLLAGFTWAEVRERDAVPHNPS